MSFTFPSLFFVWLLPLVALPVLIHLINLLRHRRVQWAAMEFLLESKKKNQNWIRLKQLFLLLARMAAIAAIVFLLAGPLLKDQWSALFGGGKTHHIILLDDSGSMTDRWAATNAFGRARDVVQSIISRARRQSSQQSLTLLRFSHAAAGQQPEIVRQAVTEELEVEFEQLKEGLVATPLAVGPLAALERLESAFKPEDDENTVLYVVSDLRTVDWQDSAALQQVLQRLAGDDVQVQLVHCVDEARPNLAVTHLGPTPGQQATGVLIRMAVEVTNFGDQTATNIPVQLQQTVYSSAGDEEGDVGSLGAEKFDKIEPGQSLTQTFDVTFSTPGSHEIRAALPSDPIALDNQRFCVVDVSADVPVLIIDDGGEDNAVFLRLALAPSSRVRTGVKARIERSTFLREQPLDTYHTIYLLNTVQLDAQEIENLEAYVKGGGGVVMFTGNESRRDFVNGSLYRDGSGFFPLPVAAPTTLLVDRLVKSPDIQVQMDHPVFERTFGGAFNTWLQAIVVQRYFGAAKNWNPADDPSVSVIASLRDGAPLIVEKRYGEGRVLAVLTTAAPIWHNWGRNDPSFVLWVLDTQVYLGSRKVAQPLRELGSPLTVELVGDDYQSAVEFVVPAESARRVVQGHATPIEGSSTRRTVTLTDVTQPGFYEVKLERLDGRAETRRYAYNPTEAESDLRTVDQGELRALLQDVPFEYRDAGEFLAPVTQQAGFPLAEQWWFFLALVLLLVVEQLLAYSASYHPPLKKGAARR